MSNPLDDPQAFLAAVVSSTDPAITIRERLDAMRLLNDLGGFRSPEVDILAEQAAEMGDDELDRMRDTDLVDVLRSISGFYPEHVWPEPGDPAKRFPQAVAALERVWTERAKQLAVDLYVAEGLNAAEHSGAPEPEEPEPGTPGGPVHADPDFDEPEPEPEEPETGSGPPPGLSFEDLARPWQGNRRSAFRRR